MDVEKTIAKALAAIKEEIIAVREVPSRDVLVKGLREKGTPKFIYTFETRNQGLRFAEEIKAEFRGQEQIIHPLEFKDGKIRLEFPEDAGPEIDEVFLEWENDFVLVKTEEQLFNIADSPGDYPQIEVMLNPPAFYSGNGAANTNEYSTRNASQNEAIKKALQNNILYVWGPPGTGKTTTLGYIVAEYLQNNKKVLFVSNTNRAVDVGLLSVLNALQEINPGFDKKYIARFGDAVLENDSLTEVLFEAQIERRLLDNKEKAAQLSSLLGRYQELQTHIDKLMARGEEVPEELDLQCRLLGEKTDWEGGPAALEEKIERLLHVNERSELRKRRLVATTLAKVCTSDLFYGLKYDAVVVDEASMAGIPFLLVMASKSESHLVIAGDPMQLPPIAVTADFEARTFLEKDVFTYVSGAETAEGLFSWHDSFPDFTCFFDTQYRMKSDLARVISSVFYEGRLKTDAAKNTSSKKSVALVDSSKYGPAVTQESRDRGFRPVNEVHLKLLEESVRKLTRRYADSAIGIIVPFRSSVYATRKYLSSKGFRYVEVGTIHTFQGREKEVIIFDTVMSGEIQYGQKRHYSVRPFDETKNGMSVPRLLNVAFSRSKEMLVIIADMDHITNVYGNKFLGKLLSAIKEISL